MLETDRGAVKRLKNLELRLSMRLLFLLLQDQRWDWLTRFQNIMNGRGKKFDLQLLSQFAAELNPS